MLYINQGLVRVVDALESPNGRSPHRTLLKRNIVRTTTRIAACFLSVTTNELSAIGLRRLRAACRPKWITLAVACTAGAAMLAVVPVQSAARRAAATAAIRDDRMIRRDIPLGRSAIMWARSRAVCMRLS
jgi:hypothetical protein